MTMGPYYRGSSDSVGLYGSSSTFGGTYFEWFVFQVSSTQPATPTDGSWSFTTNSGTPPTGWSSNPPPSPSALVWVSIANVNSRNTNALVWSVPGQFAFSSGAGLAILTGAGTPSPGDGANNQLYFQTDTAPQTIWLKESGTWTRITGSVLYADLTSNQTLAGTKTFSSPIAGSVTGTSANVTGIVAVGNGGTGSTTSTGSGSVVLSTSPTLITPLLGTPTSGNFSTGTFTWPTFNQNTTGNAATATTATNVSGGTSSVTTLTASSTVTLSGGTANGVAYLNGSKVLTTGSALTFDGTNLGVGIGGAGTAPIDVASNGSAIGLMLRGRSADSIGTLQFQSNDGATVRAQIQSRGDELRYLSAGNVPQTYFVNGSEQMRLTSTGLGIGTSSPSDKLHIYGANPYFLLQGSETSAQTLYIRESAGGMFFGQYGVSTRMLLDSAGNLGLGVTPSAWGSTYKVLQVGLYTGLSYSGGTSNLTTNAYNNGNNWLYGATDYASQYKQQGGAHYFYIAPSGTAGNAITFTQAMTLDASGRLLLGTTAIVGSFDMAVIAGANATANDLTLYGPSTSQVRLQFSRSGAIGRGEVGYNMTDDAMRFVTSSLERARIDSSGNLLVGQTSAWPGTTPRMEVKGNGSQHCISSWNSAATNAGVTAILGRIDNSTGNYLALWYSGSSTQVGSITTNGTITVYNTTSDYRLKTIVGAVSDSGSRIDALQPVEYTWKSDGSRTRGFLAHQFQEVYAGSVTGTKDAVDADGKPVYQAMQASTSEVIADLVAEIQSLRTRLAALEAK